MTREQIALMARKSDIEAQIRALRIEAVEVQRQIDALSTRLELVEKVKSMGQDEKLAAIRILQSS